MGKSAFGGENRDQIVKLRNYTLFREKPILNRGKSPLKGNNRYLRKGIVAKYDWETLG